MWFLSLLGFQLQEHKHAYWGIVFRNSWQNAEECVAEAHGLAEHERIRYGGRSAGVRFRLRTVVPARRHLTTRQCHNKHANCWETIAARITDLIKLCQREQVGENVSARWFQDIRSALKREVQIGLEEAMANSSADDEWTSEQWRQILLDPQQFDLDDLEESQRDAARQGLRQESPGNGTRSGKGVGGGGTESRRQACTQMDCKNWDEAAAGRGGDQWVITLLYAS